ncbi:MAG: FKBP-type peptidyl-prolyl cis-trans isomerase [Bacteroidales bacterium]|nr:FKBP-type peptidyl-prolyl cis-trans isomerase [Bacteroidales bacterium]
MFKKSFILFAAVGSMLLFSCNVKNKSMKETDLDTQMKQVSYGLGISAGAYYHKQGLDSLDVNAFAAGLQAAITQDTANMKMSEAQANAVLQKYFSELSKKKSEIVKKKGEDFLAENAKKDSVVTLPDGLQYKILKEGNGAKPSATDKVKVHYTGRLLDGTVFDSSVERGEPITFQLNRVIPGWTEALQLMPVGSKWRLFIPSDLAYGERGAGQTIPPNSTLIFDVELLGIEK